MVSTLDHVTELLKNVSGDSIWPTTIQMVLKQNNPIKTQLLICQLKDQARDNPPAMVRILGFDILKY